MSDSTNENQPRSNKFFRIVLPILVLAAGAGAAAALILSRTPPERHEKPNLGPLVEVMEAEAIDRTVEVDGQGEVRARVRVELLPEVAGRVVAVHPSLEAGGRFRAGEVLVRLDPRDYELAIESARASIASAETRLEQERAEAEAALAEWRDVHGEDEPPALLVREPQIRQLDAERAAAVAQLRRAELDLERTRLSLPFDGVVLSESVDPGQYLARGQSVATVYGADALEVRVPLPDEDLRWFDVPRSDASQGPPAEIAARFAGERHVWPGRVDRLEGEVDRQTRMVHVVLRVDDAAADGSGRPPLLPGTFVEVAIEGRTIEDVFQLPRHALRPGNVVWLVEDGALRIREVDVMRSDRRFAYVNGLADGATLVTSSLDGVVDGMSVRTAEASADRETPSEPESPGSDVEPTVEIEETAR